MFQTEINHFFQSFASEALTKFMVGVTSLGYLQFFLVFLISLLLAIHFKKGFLLFMVLIWTAAITFFFKEYFDLPRPFHVDDTIQLLDRQLPGEARFDFSKRGGNSFWEGLPADVLAVTRASDTVENGFPSGHSSVAIAFWGALALLFRKRWILLISTALMLLIPLSRLYLGVHFLADVLGGIFLGAIILGVFYIIILKPDRLAHYLKRNNYSLGLDLTSAVLLLSPLVLLFILKEEVYILLAFMFGFGLGFLLLAKKGLPASSGTIWQRIGRTIVGFSAFAIVGFLGNLIVEQTNLANVWVDFIRNALAGLALIWIGTEISIRLGWFVRGEADVV